jgi:hypothetical protein
LADDTRRHTASDLAKLLAGCEPISGAVNVIEDVLATQIRRN